ncbi:metallophosphoesterase family protein [Cyclobacterium roseum]|uniref:metallophosphoesterase family protein n=1 Tax=Cyclobacterium roseum TaxID=2666137 RepID=UPI001390C1AC|nr:metallophosphoesterase [Cyclobacterium roseum]
MKRRKFISRVGASSSFFLLGSAAVKKQQQGLSPFLYAQPTRFSEVLNQNGQFQVRLEIRTVDQLAPKEVRLEVRKPGAQQYRVKAYPFANKPERVDEANRSYTFEVGKAFPFVFAVWIDRPEPGTKVNLVLNGKPLEFTLGNLVERRQLSYQEDGIQLSCNYLLDKEMGVLDPAKLGIAKGQKQFSFVILADPQGGNPDTPKAHPTRMKIHNAFIWDSVNRVNELTPQPAFSLVLGDIVDNQGEVSHFEAMHEYLKGIRSPVLYAIGNHETRYQASFTPGYRMEEFDAYFSAQKAMNGMEWLLYSFDLGDWHFIVWPDPLRSNFFETHPHYFDWLERDLEQNKDRPTLFFQHVPSHPIGIDPLINYAESVAVKRLVLDILAKHGNVRYVLSGHVHIPIRASLKTATQYKGMRMINLPAAGYRPRAFGEEEVHGGPSQGVLVVEVNGTTCNVYFKTVMEEVYSYPESLPEFSETKFPLWLNYKWQLEAGPEIRNGDFSQGLAFWNTRYVYGEDENPSNRMEVRKFQGYQTLYLFSSKRKYHIPGQDRLPQTINHLCQSIAVGVDPFLIRLDYCLDKENAGHQDSWAGGFVWLEGFQGSVKLLNLAYWIGKGNRQLSDRFTDSEEVPLLHYELPAPDERWQEARLNWRQDYGDQGLDLSGLDRLVINLGTWHINDGNSPGFGVYFTNLNRIADLGESQVAGGKIRKMPDEALWRMNKYEPFVHIAGEHRYIMSTQNPKQ